MDMSYGQHISSKFNDELEHVRTKVLEMGGIVEQQLGDALKALESGNEELAEKVIASDVKINQLELEIDEACTQIIAQRQPAASDLRLVISVLKTISDLERMGDEAQRVGRMAKQLATQERPRDNYSELRHLGELVKNMLKSALDAFARMDIETAKEVMRQDDEADSEYEALIRQSMTYMMENSQAIPRFMNVIWSARSLERIGDRACNIAEYVVYFVKGEDIRHSMELKEQILDE